MKKTKLNMSFSCNICAGQLFFSSFIISLSIYVFFFFTSPGSWLHENVSEEYMFFTSEVEVAETAEQNCHLKFTLKF